MKTKNKVFYAFAIGWFLGIIAGSLVVYALI